MTTDPTQLSHLLDYLYRTRGFDFRGYKSPGLMRRILHRMQEIEVSDFDAYIDRLEVDAGEFNALFNTILINVTSFFRDGPVWEALAALLRERLVPPRTSLRVWCAGCASGQEAYTLAIVMAEILGVEAFGRTVKIYATDIDDEALNQARLGSYSAREVSSVPPPMLDRYFERVQQRYVVHKDIRKCLIFGRHNLLQDAPISRVDILSCRNTLMYFNAEAQAQIIHRFHFALRDASSTLFLGKAEMMAIHSNLFAPLDLKRRIFTKLNPGPARSAPVASLLPDPEAEALQATLQARLRESMFELSPQAQIALDTHQHLVLVNERASVAFGLHAHSVGRSFPELAIGQHDELRASVDRVLVERRVLVMAEFTWIAGSTASHYEVHIAPVLGAQSALLGVQLSFLDISAQRRLQHRLQQINREFETTNEELQSTTEELETTNEELRQRSEELNQVNSFLHSILSSLHMGVAVLDHEMLVRVWNHRAKDLWGLSSDEVVGRHFLNLDIGLPVDQLRPHLRACLGGESEREEVVLDALNRRGKHLACKVICTPLWPRDAAQRGAMLLMEPLPAPSEPS